MNKLLITMGLLLSISLSSSAEVRKEMTEINTDAFTLDTQATAENAGDDHMALTWWIPNEFWMAILSRDASLPEADKKAMLDALSGVSLLAVVQADISRFGAFTFYSKEYIENKMSISFVDANKKEHRLYPLKDISPDLEIVLGVFKPILGAAMGNLGSNFHFYVLADKTGSSNRLLNPYNKGNLSINLVKKDRKQIMTGISMPLNSLFVPRKCPNGKDAHVTWNYCPWSGKKL